MESMERNSQSNLSKIYIIPIIKIPKADVFERILSGKFTYSYCLAYGNDAREAVKNVLKYKDCPEFSGWHIDLDYNTYVPFTQENLYTFCLEHDILCRRETDFIFIPSINPIILPEVYHMALTDNDVKQALDDQFPSVPDIYDYMYFGDYNAKIEDLAKIAQPEKWDFPDTNNNVILKNYLDHTFRKLFREGKVIETENYCLINTGLFTQFYDQIYVHGIPNDSIQAQGYIQKWKFVGFKDKYELGNVNITELPERANYFSDPGLLIFNPQLPINIQYKHILADESNLSRLPDELQNFKNTQALFSGAIDITKKKIVSNYKLAIPQYFGGKIQLLLPLYLLDQEKPDLALVVSKNPTGEFYQGHTCLTLKMAYNNARLIAKPDSSWLDIL